MFKKYKFGNDRDTLIFGVIVLLIIIIVIIVLIIIISSKIVFNIKFLKDNKNDEMIITIKLFHGVYTYKKEIPLIDLDVEDKKLKLEVSEESETNTTNGIINENHKKFDIETIIYKIRKAHKIFIKYYKPINYLINRVYWQSLVWRTEIGLDDAAITGFSTGLIGIFKGNILSFLYNQNIKFEKFNVKAVPNFESEIIKTSIDCIFSIKIGYIIIAGLKSIKIKYL